MASSACGSPTIEFLRGHIMCAAGIKGRHAEWQAYLHFAQENPCLMTPRINPEQTQHLVGQGKLDREKLWVLSLP
jgi:hypothetical protein